MIDFLFFALPFIGKNFLHVLPLLLITLPIAEWLKRSGLAERYVPALRAKPLLGIIIATAIGAVSPLCSCGVIPVIAGFLRAGLPLGPVMAFWIASPSMDPEIFALSAGMLGLPLATGRLIATGVLSVAAGFGASLLEKRGVFGSHSLRGQASRTWQDRRSALQPFPASPSAPAFSPGTRFTPLESAGLTTACGCSAQKIEDGKTESPPSMLSAIARASLTELPKLAGIMILAFALEAVVLRFVPIEIVAPLFGSNSKFGILLATAIGVPLYATNLAALGLVSGLVENGMSGGAALAFLVGGAATTIPAMAAVWTLVKPRLFAYYVAAIALGALATGYLYEAAIRALG